MVDDDSSTMRRIIINTLNTSDIRRWPRPANGREGLDRLSASGPVDVIITDWNMPEMSGTDFMRSMPDIKDTSLVIARRATLAL
jgi:two-component system chemotaxis response regulator CheY